MNLETAYKQQLEWLIKMAQQPGFKAHAWQRAQELDKVELFAGIAQDLKEHMLKLSDGQKKAGG